MTLPSQVFVLLFHIFFLCWGLTSDTLQTGKTEKKMTLTCICCFFLSFNPSGLCSSFFSGHYIPSGLISFIFHWLGCQNSFLHYCALLKGGSCCLLSTASLICLEFCFFFITSISFFLLCLSQWQQKRINYCYEAGTPLCVKQSTFALRKCLSL
jgi:hypothetical protein